MSRFRIVKRGSPTPAPTALLIGTDINYVSYWDNNVIFTDHSKNAVWASMPSGANLSETKLSATRWPTGPNTGGDTAVRATMVCPEVAGDFAVTFTPGITPTAAPNCSITTLNAGAGTATVAVSVAQPSGSGWGLDFPGGAVSALTAKPVGDSSTFSARAVSHIAAMTRSGATIRPMDMTGVNGNLGNTGTAWSGGTQASPTYLISAATRNTAASGEWRWQSDADNAYRSNDGVPFEVLVAMANALGRDLWWNRHWNANPDYDTAIANYAALNLNGKLYVEVANEVWNTGFPVFAQARAEGRYKGLPGIFGDSFAFTGSVSGTTLTVTAVSGTPFSGVAGSAIPIGGNGMLATTLVTAILTGSGGIGTYTVSQSQTVSSATLTGNSGAATERHAELSMAVFDRFTAAYNSNGVSLDKLVRVMAIQNAIPSWATFILDYKPDGVTALKSKLDVIASAPYFGNLGTVPDGTDVTAIFAAAHLEIATAVGYAATIQAAGAARTNDRGNTIKYATYEGGQHLILSDATTRTAVQRDSRMYTEYKYYLGLLESTLGPIVFNHYYLHGAIGGSGAWGALEASLYGIDDVSPSAQKAKAMRDYILGV